MDDFPLREEALISSVFSDETPLFRTPAEPENGDEVAVRVRVRKGAEVQAALLMGYPAAILPMEKVKTDPAFDWFEARFQCAGNAAVFYSFLISWKGRYIHCRKTGAELTDSIPFPDPDRSFRVLPGFHVPAWAKGAVQYQIFPDRFCNGDPANDVMDREYSYAGDYVRRITEWDALPQEGDFRRFYGGDLKGILDKLDYLQSLGVEALYLNPVFVSPSNHKYDTQDYAHVDPHLTVIARDGGRVLKKNERKNVRAAAYIQRTTLPENLEASDAYFASFCRELHRRGMKIILDGVFNHCGSFNRWMDKERLYEQAGGYRPGAYGHPNSPYRNYFQFHDAKHYDSWWNVDTLPKLNYEASWELCEEIMKTAEKWVSPPYSVDGWRLDVGADLGHSSEFNHVFWKEFRRRVKAANPNALIVAEHYGNPAAWLEGGEWDSVMNYDAFMEPVSYFLTGMEKHSDSRRDDLFRNGGAFFGIMMENMARMPLPSLHCAMNELSNHDHSRFMTRTNGRAARLRDAGSEAAAEGVQPAVYREAAVIQMTWPGAPTLYYGDEAGLTGWTDPDNRRPYPWGREDQDLIAMHRALARLRGELPFLREGSLKPLCWDSGFIAYARFDAERCAVVACNNGETAQVISLPLWTIGVEDGTEMIRRFLTDEEGFRAEPVSVGAVRKGTLLLRLAPRSAAVLIPAKGGKKQ